MSKLIVDFFRNTPLYMKDNKIEESNFNLLQQTYSVDGNNYFLNCENSKVIRIDNNTYTSTLYSEMNTFRKKNQIMTKNNEGLDLLLKILSTKLNSDNLKFLFPDIFNEFDLSKLYKLLKRGYKKVESMPKSIAAVFYYENIKKLNKRILEEKKLSILVIDLIGEELTLTLIKPTEINETKLKDEIIWERYPTVIEKISEEKFDALYNKIDRNECNIFNLTRKNEEKIKLKIVKKNKIFDIGNDLNINSIDISSYINKFLENHKEIIGDYNQNTELHVISLSHNLKYNIAKNYKIEKKNILDSEVLMGYNRYLEKYEKLIGKSETIDLWKDYLPGLAIKLLFGKFDLIGDEGLKIIPKLGRKEEISIKNTFTIVKNESNVYRFPLIKTGISQKVNIEAVLRPQVKLKENVECKLRLTYTYGSEKPYELIFEPLDSNTFSELKAKWEKKIEDNLEYIDIKEIFKINDNMEKFVKKDIEKYYNYCIGNYLLIDFSKDKVEKIKAIKTKVYYLIKDNENNEIILKKYINNNNNNDDITKGIKYKTVFIEKDNKFVQGIINPNNWKDRGKGKFNIDSNYMYMGKNIVFFESMYIDNSDLMVSNIKYIPKENERKGNYIAHEIHSSNKIFGKIRKLDFMFSESNFNRLYNLIGNYKKENKVIELRDIYEQINKIKPYILSLYIKTSDNNLKSKIIHFMSLNNEVFSYELKFILDELINKFKENNFIPDEIGYYLASQNFSISEIKKILKKLFKLNVKKAMNIFSKSIWFSNRLIEELETEEILNYFKNAVNSLEKSYAKISIKNKKYKEFLEKDIEKNLMLILGLLRKRGVDKENNMLSMYNRDFQRCYEIIEKLSKIKLEINSFLNLKNKIDNKDKNIPDLLIIVAKYLTGYKIDIEIDISIEEEKEMEEDDS